MVPVRFRQLRRQQDFKRLAGDLVSRIAEHLLGTLIKEQDVMRMIYRDDGIISQIEDPGKWIVSIEKAGRLGRFVGRVLRVLRVRNSLLALSFACAHAKQPCESISPSQVRRPEVFKSNQLTRNVTVAILTAISIFAYTGPHRVVLAVGHYQFTNYGI
jgi:hypothetical protein